MALHHGLVVIGIDSRRNGFKAGYLKDYFSQKYVVVKQVKGWMVHNINKNNPKMPTKGFN